MSAPNGNGAAAGDALAPLTDARQRCASAPLGERFTLRFHAQLAERLEQTTQSGEPFLRLRFNDGAADLELRVWRRTTWWDACAALETGAFCEVRGTFVRRQAKYGADPERLEVRPLDATERAAALLGPPARREKLAIDLKLIEEKIDSVRDPRLQALAQRFLHVHGARFRRACAARTYHHARRGGLVEHVAGMMRGAEGICAAYPHLKPRPAPHRRPFPRLRETVGMLPGRRRSRLARAHVDRRDARPHHGGRRGGEPPLA